MKDRKLGIIIGLFLLISFFIWVIVDYSGRNKEYSKIIYYMDTYINVKLYTNNSSLANDTINEIEKIYKEYHQLTDRYNSYEGINNVYYINNNDSSLKTITLDKRLYDLLSYGVDAYTLTNGLININIGNVVDVWKKYRENKSGIPTIDELKKSGSIDIKNIKLLLDNQILNNHPNIDLGCIAKGYVTDVVKDYIKSKGIKAFLVNAGGNVIVGEHYNNSLYKIGIETPSTEGGVYDVVSLTNKAVTTSGSYQRFYEYDGKTYHHIIDPNTLYPSNYLKSVSVITDDTKLGDILSTALFLMSIEDGKKFLNNFDADAIWYTLDDEIITTEGFKNYEQE